MCVCDTKRQERKDAVFNLVSRLAARLVRFILKVSKWVLVTTPRRWDAGDLALSLDFHLLWADLGVIDARPQSHASSSRRARLI